MRVELLRSQAKQVLLPQPPQWDQWLTSQLNGPKLRLQRPEDASCGLFGSESAGSGSGILVSHGALEGIALAG